MKVIWGKRWGFWACLKEGFLSALQCAWYFGQTLVIWALVFIVYLTIFRFAYYIGDVLRGLE